jgi:hypothetical protein
LSFIAIAFLLCVERESAPLVLGEARVQGIFGALASALNKLRGITSTYALVAATHPEASFGHGHFKGRDLRWIGVLRPDAASDDHTRKN